MGCNSDYMEPNYKEAFSKTTAQLLVYVLTSQGKTDQIDKDLQKAASDPYGMVAKSDEMTARLCALVGKMGKREMNKIVYDGRNAQARELAGWWERHQAADAARMQKEAQQAAKVQQESADKKLVDQALKKLAPEEQAALKRVMKR